ncbi:MAG TPA: ABC transporter permease [Trebonia sp.]|nr:ABC transporter permease [Trebonia sp.]
MTLLILRRLLLAVPVLLGVSIVTFASLHLIPGNPAQTLLFGTDASPQQVAALTQQLGLDRPMVIQYFEYLGRLLHGNLGESYINQVPVATEIAQRLPSTIQLAAAALVVALVIGVPAGLVAGTRPGGWLDRIATSGAVLGVAIPYFWLALVLVLIFSVKLGLVPSLGTGGFDSIILPAIALGWGFAAMIARLLRAGLIDAYAQPYVTAAQARGLSAGRILATTVFRNACGPMVAALGLQLGQLLAGAVAIEVIFGRAGLGSLLFNAISSKDIPTVQGGVLFIAVIYVALNLLVDVLKAIIDPRTRRTASS